MYNEIEGFFLNLIFKNVKRCTRVKKKTKERKNKNRKRKIIGKIFGSAGN